MVGANDVTTAMPEEIAANAVAVGMKASVLKAATTIVTKEITITETRPPLMGVNSRVEDMIIVAAV